MANQWCLDLLKEGVDAWNKWKAEEDEYMADHKDDDPLDDLSGADLSGANLYGVNFLYTNLKGAHLRGASLRKGDLRSANLMEADLSGATLMEADLSEAQLRGANLSEASLRNTNLREANFSGADLSSANLREANLSGANLSGANLSEADLSKAILVGTNLTNTTLKDCTIYGISVWDVQLDGAEQLNLRITPKKPHYPTNEEIRSLLAWSKETPKALPGLNPHFKWVEIKDAPNITVDNLKIAQFIYLLLNNKEIRDAINTLTTKCVLILGRFTPERKAILDALRESLRQHNYLPILFDFDPTNTQTIRETVRTLAHLSYFIIADLTNASSIPEELETIVPTLAVPVQPLLERAQTREFSMFKSYGLYPWVLPIYRYTDLQELLDNVQEKVIQPATQKAGELAARKVQLNLEPFDQTT